MPKVNCIRTRQRWNTLHTGPKCNAYTVTYREKRILINEEYEVERETKTQYILKIRQTGRDYFMRVSKDDFQVIRDYSNIKSQILGVDK